MLKYEMFDGDIFLSTNDGKTFGYISYVDGLGFFLFVSVECTKAHNAIDKLDQHLPAFKSLEAIKYFALSLYLEHGAE